MRIAYLLNSYPMTSTTFIRREIEALVEAGVDVRRYAARHWDGELVDPLDIDEQKRTRYLLTGNTATLLRAFATELVTNPVGLARASRAAWKLFRNARQGIGRHAAYLMQATYFRQSASRDAITHVHAHFSTNATSIAMLSYLMGGPGYSFTAHGPDEFDDTESLSLDLKMRHAKFIAAISDFCRSKLAEGDRQRHWNKISIVHCGLALEEFAPNQEFSIENQTFVNVARFTAQKGLLLIPSAVAKLKHEFPRLKVVLIGDGPDRPLLEAEIARHDVASVIELKGWRPNDEVRAALATCRALLLPSFAEGLPVVIMESFALGRPVISTYIAGIPELVDASCGWLVPAGNTEELSVALRSALLASPDRLREMGAEGRRRALEQHDIAVSARQLQALFKSAPLTAQAA